MRQVTGRVSAAVPAPCLSLGVPIPYMLQAPSWTKLPTCMQVEAHMIKCTKSLHSPFSADLPTTIPSKEFMVTLNYGRFTSFSSSIALLPALEERGKAFPAQSWLVPGLG